MARDRRLCVSARDCSNNCFRVYISSVPVRDVRGVLTHGLWAVLRLGIHAIFRFLCALDHFMISYCFGSIVLLLPLLA